MDDDYFTIRRKAAAPGSDGVVESYVELTGELDIGARDAVREVLLDIVDRESSRRTMVDLKDVAFIDSEAISAILDGYVAAQQVGKTLVLINANGVVRRVFHIIGMDELMRDLR
ncbi:STAS domain-containing protein [Actinoplanes sp. Pm04-4]|uniref:Anti-sigma factor antagonist n=1 Tax=Paractinoplanes pyxinae TaxID=2997416 RepID=A0ABT4BCB3_9ACTN|nr:STAS domain-containing protein [Actinoplanes pyxinae]MCY1144155.1 STAS domain-containing protein [Actinoplanes pyxinae]